MRVRLAVFGLLPILASCAMAQAKGDWSDVRRIDLDRLISVRAGERVRCEFFYATDDMLVCNQVRVLGPTARREFTRKEIREVRFELTEQTNVLVNGCIGGAAGLLAGVASQSRDRPGAVDPILVVMGAFVGAVGFHRLHVVHGPVVYRR